jgi:hypothetical protein
LQFLIKKKLILFSAVIFFQFLVIKALDPDPDPYWPPSGSTGSGSGSVKNEYGSETLKKSKNLDFYSFVTSGGVAKTNIGER